MKNGIKSKRNKFKMNEQINEQIKIITRKNGRSYSVRTNRDRIFYPGEWMKYFDCLTKKQQHTNMFLISTMGRINEIRNILVKDCDLERKRIVLRVTKVKAKKGEKHPRPRIIPVSSQFASYLKKYIKTNKLKPEDNFNIPSTAATNIAMKKALQKAKIDDWYMFSVHNIRKTGETWLMALGIDGLKIVAHIGHSMAVAASNYISADIYTWEEKEQMRRILGDLYQR